MSTSGRDLPQSAPRCVRTAAHRSTLRGAAIGLVLMAVGAGCSSNDPESPPGRVTDAPMSTFVEAGSSGVPDLDELGPFDNAEPNFTDAELTALTRGVEFTDRTADAGLPTEGGFTGDAISSGAGVADIDGDGDLDVTFTGSPGASGVFLNDGDLSFSDGSHLGIEFPHSTHGLLWADVTGDGRLDLVLGPIGPQADGRILFYVQQADGTFAEQAAERGLLLPAPGPAAIAGVAAGDPDGDGDLDLVLAGVTSNQVARGVRPAEGPGTLRLFENDGAGGFTDVTDDAGLGDLVVSAFGAVFADADGDSDHDLFVTGDWGTSQYLENTGDLVFANRTSEAGVGTDENGMGSVVVDLDGDGNLDWFVTSIGVPREGCLEYWSPTRACSGNRLFLGDGSGSFRDATAPFGLRQGGFGWGAFAADIDHDGDRDLGMTNGLANPADFIGVNDTSQRASLALDPPRLWLNVGDEAWPDVAETIGLTRPTSGKAFIAADLDRDGDLDILQSNTFSRPRVHENTSTGLPPSLTVQVDASDGQLQAYGATVTVDMADGQTLTGILGATQVMSNSPIEAHFGLGSSTVVRLTVTLSDGRTLTRDAPGDGLISLGSDDLKPSQP